MHLWDLINASQRRRCPRSSAFLWHEYTSCCSGHSVTSRAVLLPLPRPGPAQVTRVSRLCPCFLTPCFATSWKKQCCLIFPGRSFISIPTSCTRSHTERDRVNLFIRLADFCFSALCFSVQFIQVQIHRNQTALPRILFCSRNCSWTPLFSPLLLCTFLSSLHLLQRCPQRPSSNHHCAHRSGSVRAYYLIFPKFQILKSIFLPWIFFSHQLE